MSSVEPWDDARAKIEAASLVGGRVQWPNEPFVVPSNPRLVWISVSMAGDGLEPIEMGPRGSWQEEGFLRVDIYTPSAEGSRNARALGKQIVNLFRGLAPGPVTYHRASMGDNRAEDIDGAWWRFTVTVDYRYQELVS